jgi:replicative DNA helicase
VAEDLLKRVPPQSIDAEMAILGAILLDNESINQSFEILLPEDFYHERHRIIFRAMTELSDRNVPLMRLR